MRAAARVDRPVGRCYQCRRPVWAHEATRVPDVSVSSQVGRRVRRLAHVGACADELRDRIGPGAFRGFEP